MKAGTVCETIAYVPLDDRPDNVERVVYLAESLGYALSMPDADLYRTRLDGQPLNANGTQYGDLAALYDWVLEQESAGCDRYILSLDQLLSGGLVNSRHTAGRIPLSGSVSSDWEILESLIPTLAADPDNQIWLLDSVMRLAPTVGYAGFDIDAYHALRAYGMESRPVLAGTDLTVETVQATYSMGGDEMELLPADFGLTEAQVADYLAARSRKLELTAYAQELAREYQNIHFLIGIDDSSEADSIQKNEIALLRQGLREEDALLSGVDDLAFKAAAKLYLKESSWTGASVSVRYFGETEQLPACAYDSQPLTEIMSEHLAFFGLREQAQDAAMQILVLTQPALAEQKESYCRKLTLALRDCQANNIPVILIDAGNGQYGTAFHEMLTQETELGGLLSYSGFLDMAIVTGTALSHGVARFARLQVPSRSEAAEQAFIRTLADSILKDFCYKNVVRDDLLTYIKDDLSANPDNFWNPVTDRDAILARLDQGMSQATERVRTNLENSHFIVSLSPFTEQPWVSITLENYRFPWDRAFEISMDIQLGE